MQRIWLAGLAALLVCTSGAAKAQVSDDVVKIGVLTDMSGPASTRDRSGLGGGSRNGGSGFRRQRVGQADHGDFRRPSAKARCRRRHCARMVRPRSGRPDRRRAGVRGRAWRCRASPTKRKSSSSPIRPAPPISTASSARPTRCNGCSTPTRSPSAPRKKSSSAAAPAGSSSPPITPSVIRSRKTPPT